MTPVMWDDATPIPNICPEANDVIREAYTDNGAAKMLRYQLGISIKDIAQSYTIVPNFTDKEVEAYKSNEPIFTLGKGLEHKSEIPSIAIDETKGLEGINPKQDLSWLDMAFLTSNVASTPQPEKRKVVLKPKQNNKILALIKLSLYLYYYSVIERYDLFWINDILKINEHEPSFVG